MSNYEALKAGDDRAARERQVRLWLTESYGNPAVDRVPDIEALGWDMSFVPGAVNALLAWREAKKGSPAVPTVPGAAGQSAKEGAATSSPSSPMKAAPADLPLSSSAPVEVGAPLAALVASPPTVVEVSAAVAS